MRIKKGEIFLLLMMVLFTAGGYTLGYWQSEKEYEGVEHCEEESEEKEDDDETEKEKAIKNLYLEDVEKLLV